MEITITTKNLRRRYEAETGQKAVQMFFDDVKADNVSLHELGFIGNWTDGKEDHPFRIGLALYRCGLLSKPDLDASFESAQLEFEPAQVAAMANADAWMVRMESR